MDAEPDDDDAAALELARARARWARRFRQLLVEEVSGGRLPVDELLAHDSVEPMAGDIKVVVLLQALPGVGKVRARRALERVGAADGVRLGGLDLDRRRQLAAILSDPGA